MTETTTPRGKILEAARALTEGDRNKTYGDPYENLKCYADLCESYLWTASQGRAIDAVDAAMLLVLAKVSRVAVNKHHQDNYTDMAVYAAIAGECAEVIRMGGKE